MPEQMKLFDNELMGYKKSDVNDYIEKLDKSGLKLKEDLEKALTELAAANTKLYSSENAAEELVKVKESLHMAEEKLISLDALQMENEELKNELSAANRHLSVLESENTELKGKLSTREFEYAEKIRAEKDTLTDKFAYLERISAEAREKAEEVVAEAKVKAQELLAQAKQKAIEESENVTRESKQLIEENMRKLKYLYRRRDDLKLLFEEQKKKVEELFHSIEDNFPKE